MQRVHQTLKCWYKLNMYRHLGTELDTFLVLCTYSIAMVLGDVIQATSLVINDITK